MDSYGWPCLRSEDDLGLSLRVAGDVENEGAAATLQAKQNAPMEISPRGQNERAAPKSSAQDIPCATAKHAEPPGELLTPGLGSGGGTHQLPPAFQSKMLATGSSVLGSSPEGALGVTYGSFGETDLQDLCQRPNGPGVAQQQQQQRQRPEGSVWEAANRFIGAVVGGWAAATGDQRQGEIVTNPATRPSGADRGVAV